MEPHGDLVWSGAYNFQVRRLRHLAVTSSQIREHEARHGLLPNYGQIRSLLSFQFALFAEPLTWSVALPF